jgi:hypothetical protein
VVKNIEFVESFFDIWLSLDFSINKMFKDINIKFYKGHGSPL